MLGFKNPITKDLRIREWTYPACNTNHIRDVNAALNLKQNAIEKIKDVRQGVSELSKTSVESVEALAELALADCGAFDEAENLTGNGQNVFTHKYVKG